MSDISGPRASSRTALIVLILGLAATAFAFWREGKLTAQNRHIQMQDGLAILQPQLGPRLGQNYNALYDPAKTTLRAANYSPAGWQQFIQGSEWRSRYPGMRALGYAEFQGQHCLVKYCDATADSLFAPGTDLAQWPAVAAALQKSAAASYGQGSPPIQVAGDDLNIGLIYLPKQDQRPGLPAENVANLQGFIFFALDQPAAFAALLPQLQKLPFALRLLKPGEATPERTENVRPFTNGGVAGEWRLVATLPPAPLISRSQWTVLAGGLALSSLLFLLFRNQARLRLAAEQAHYRVLQRDAEISALNRNLEQKVVQRTEQLHAALAEEKELNRLKSNFISMVTHEIRTPLALILGSSEILSRYLDRLPAEKRAEHLKTIDASVQRMSGLLEDVLLFSKAEAGRMEFTPQAMDLQVFSTQLVDELHSATNRRCPIELTCLASDPARADEKLLRHILTNLVTNAVKYSPAGVPVQFHVCRDGGDAVFQIRDRGMGIPEEDRKRLFTPFYRGKNVATIPGTGLGLVIVKHCVERHGGTIEMGGEVGGGTIVTVRLPLFSPAHTEFIKRFTDSPTP